MFDEVHIKPRDIKKIVVVNGPGSFTGIRIGITLAKLMAYSLSIPITTISSLEAMKESVNNDILIVPILNARRNSCYAAIYDGDNAIQEGKYMTIDKLKLMLIGLNKPYMFVSNDKFDFDTIEYNPDFKRIIEKYKDRNAISAHLVNPNYLKLTEAEENKMKEEN
jgi:tRNA threonylcarbamoyladenosine biosynthesis protein TsaB